MSEQTPFVPMTTQSEGKSIDEAIFKGLKRLGLSIDEVEIATLQEGTKGILGIGAKPFIVELKQRNPNDEMEDWPQEDVQDSAAGDTHSTFFEDTVTKEHEHKHASDTPHFESKREEAEIAREEGISRVTEPVSYQEYIPGTNHVDGADFLLGMIERMGLTATLEYYEDESSIKFRIDSPTRGILIGHRGETLDAIQYLVSLVVNKDGGNYRYVQLDTENYRVKRETALIRLARKSAAQVVSTGRPYVFEPMKPYERRVLHAALADYDGVTTHSDGEEYDRHVVITIDRS